MKNIILFDDEARENLLPLTFTRPVGDIRVGILTIGEKWAKHLNGKCSYITQEYLSDKFPINIKELNFIISSSILPTKELVDKILALNNNEALLSNGELLAAKISEDQFDSLLDSDDSGEIVGFEIGDLPINRINNLWEIFQKNDAEIKLDFELLTKNRTSTPLSPSNQTIGEYPIFLEEGAVVECSVLNSKAGPIYIGKNAEIMEGSLIRGPFSLGENAVVKMGAKIYGATTIGPGCKVGGEISNSVFFANSNKGHDGFIGNSVIGEWCNFGADSNNSNLKNNYDEVKLWDYATDRFQPTGQQFLGLIMGDHSKCGINTMFNTGTLVGVSANIFGAGFPRNFIPSFSWGGAGGFTTYQTQKAIDTAKRVLSRRNLEFTEEDIAIFNAVFNITSKLRTWDAK